jgi:hypothetical protein
MGQARGVDYQPARIVFIHHQSTLTRNDSRHRESLTGSRQGMYDGFLFLQQTQFLDICQRHYYHRLFDHSLYHSLPLEG